MERATFDELRLISIVFFGQYLFMEEELGVERVAEIDVEDLLPTLIVKNLLRFLLIDII